MYSNNNNNNTYSNYNDDNGNYSRGQQGNNNNYQNNLNTPNITRQPTQQQREQLQLQRQHQERLQQQMQAEDSLRLNLQNDSLHRNQHRIARQDNSNNGAASGEPKPPGYFSYPPQPHHADSSLTTSSSPDSHDDGTFRSRLRRLYRFPCSVYGKGLIGVIGVEALLVIIMQVVIVVLYFGSLVDYSLPPPPDGPNANITLPPYLDTQNESRAIPAYLIVFVFAQLFQLVFAWDAVRAQNTIELIGIVLFNLCCFVYSIFEISQIQRSLSEAGKKGFFNSKPGMSSPEVAMDLNASLRPFLIVMVCVFGITQCLVTWLAYRLFQEFGWKIYKKIGADPNIKKMYRAYQIYLVLIKVDLFFFVGFSIQFIYLTLTRRSNDPEYWLTIIILPVTIPILYIAIYAVRHESRKWMAVFLTTMLAGVVYFIYKIVRMYYGEKVLIYAGVNRFLTLFASLCLVAILLTIVNAAICYLNFGRGLKAHLIGDGHPSPNAGTSSTGGRVMEID
ncbi:hypothetical protein BG015_009324 [Linnemannia schmuckeri]|uniref:DUF7789 domain-containing protein n=1 Tax=Linnemannia schmuckeri TaxID=64567 RepID=A0A9P5RVL7_9FUNG|nr:hypothetical protein BG015_009324 [Linnemannia schmuckeri]